MVNNMNTKIQTEQRHIWEVLISMPPQPWNVRYNDFKLANSVFLLILFNALQGLYHLEFFDEIFFCI